MLESNINIAHAPDPVFVSDLEGKILLANEAVSELLGFVVSFITYYLFAKQLYEIPWNIPLVIKTLLGYLVISAISIGFLYNQPFSIWLVLGKLVIVAVLGWYLTRFIPHEQRSQLIASVPGWIKRRLVNLFSSRRS